jgi:hypothetical protein
MYNGFPGKIKIVKQEGKKIKKRYAKTDLLRMSGKFSH